MVKKMKIGKFYKINREKLEEAIKAILDKLHSEFPEIVEKWAEEQLKLKKAIKEEEHIAEELLKKPTTFEQLKEEFERKVQELRKKCKHQKLSKWMDFWWAPGHPTGYQVKICKICGMIVKRRTRCQQCGKWVEEPFEFKDEFGRIFCSEECLQKFKESFKW